MFHLCGSFGSAGSIGGAGSIGSGGSIGKKQFFHFRFLAANDRFSRDRFIRRKLIVWNNLSDAGLPDFSCCQSTEIREK
jgi:hypothetical protein